MEVQVPQHEHPLHLIDLFLEYEEYEDEHEEEDEVGDIIVPQDFLRTCKQCEKEINWFHRYYYKCAHSCDYTLHKFCAELPTTLNHKLHSVHTLTLFPYTKKRWTCYGCRTDYPPEISGYGCLKCNFFLDIRCAMATTEYQIIHHPSHPHPLVPLSRPTSWKCDACGKKHEGIFYLCTTCFGLYIHRDCAFLPKKLFIQDITNNNFSHRHPLTVCYSFPEADQEAKYQARCRVCDSYFYDMKLWILKCEKCQYYAHLSCETSRGDSSSSFGKDSKYPHLPSPEVSDSMLNLLHLPFPEVSDSILNCGGLTYFSLAHVLSRGGLMSILENKRRLMIAFSQENDLTIFKKEKLEDIIDRLSLNLDIHRNLKHNFHQHPLILVCTESSNDIAWPSSSRTNVLSCHDPMKKTELLCNGCLRPITSMPFYNCADEDDKCNFVLHEWCTRLPNQLHGYPDHPQHTLTLQQNVSNKFFSVFVCAVCKLSCNGFVYSCQECDYQIDVKCAFIPETITHKAHPNHLMSRVETESYSMVCRVCRVSSDDRFAFLCDACEVLVHASCAMLLPQEIRHRYDKHPLSISYNPIENHKSQYFCEICEEELDPERCFYHCDQCPQSIHSCCAPHILESERAVIPSWYDVSGVYKFVNIKFGGMHNIKDHPHPLIFDQGTPSDGNCSMCRSILQYEMIFKCQQCKYAIHFDCCKDLSS